MGGGGGATRFRTSCLLWNAMSRHTPVKLKPCSLLDLGLCSGSSSSSRLPVLVVKAQPNPKASQSSWVTTGLITESLADNMFWVRLENGDVVLGYLSGKIRIKNIRVLPGDHVQIEVSRYDSTRGRIIYRLANKQRL